MKKYKIANDLVPMINKIKIPTKKKKTYKTIIFELETNSSQEFIINISF